MSGLGTSSQDTTLEGRLDDRVIDVLLEHPGTVAFNGLRRALNAHPEALARALRRLERDGLVRHGRAGYEAVASAREGRSAPEERPRTLVASVGLPPGSTPEALLGALAGRWFGSLRWLGVHDYPGEPTLVWSVDHGRGHVLLSVRRGHLRVRVDDRRDSADFAVLEGAAFDLLRYALARIQRFPVDPPPTVGTVAFSALDVQPAFGAWMN